MDKSDKMKDIINCEVIHTNCHKIDNIFLCVYINNYVKVFRNYNNDEFLINISGPKKFIHKEDDVLRYLIEQLKENNFTIEFEGNEESIYYTEVTCTNLTNDTSYNFIYQIQNLPTIVELSSKTDIPIIAIITMKIVAQIISKLKILYKAIVLDLDDTLWKGNLSEAGIERIIEYLRSENGAPYIGFMKFVKTLANELGLFISVCSRNDSRLVESIIKELDETIFPLKFQIDYIIANNNDKSDNIIRIAEQLSILPNAIVFIDDNQIVRDEVKYQIPEVFVPEWTNLSELVNQLIAGCIFERFELSLSSQNRRKQYRILQIERTQNTLPSLTVKVITDDKHIESNKLYTKSNQFKFSQNDEKFNGNAKSLYFEIYRENGENLGICSAITYTITNDTFLVHNWAISCRYFEIGLEESILLYINKIANNKKMLLAYHNSEYNKKVKELMAKYSYIFINNDNNDLIEILFTKGFVDSISKNTNIQMQKNG